ncbi:hypothetical protein GC177_10090 [bacterium]|nr:hypothetical protein [bacterium]
MDKTVFQLFEIKKACPGTEQASFRVSAHYTRANPFEGEHATVIFELHSHYDLNAEDVECLNSIATENDSAGLLMPGDGLMAYLGKMRKCAEDGKITDPLFAKRLMPLMHMIHINIAPLFDAAAKAPSMNLAYCGGVGRNDTAGGIGSSTTLWIEIPCGEADKQVLTSPYQQSTGAEALGIVVDALLSGLVQAGFVDEAEKERAMNQATLRNDAGLLMTLNGSVERAGMRILN